MPADQAEKLAALVRAGGNRDVTVRVFLDVNHLFLQDPDGDFRRRDQGRGFAKALKKIPSEMRVACLSEIARERRIPVRAAR